MRTTRAPSAESCSCAPPKSTMRPAVDQNRRYLIAAVLAALTLPACAQTSEELCRREVSRLQPSCEGAALRQCWQERLSARCFKEADAGTGAKTASCKTEMQ